MAAELFTFVIFAKAVEGMTWARNSQELNKTTWLENSAKFRGFRFDRQLHVEDEHEESESLITTFRERPSVLKLPSLRVAVTNSNGSAVSTVEISPHLVIIYTNLVRRWSVGIILKRRTVLTTCVSTLITFDAELYAIKPEYFVILSESAANGTVTVQPINLVAEIRRHPFCGRPFGKGPWMNDMAVLILHKDLTQTLKPIELASENFFDIFRDVQQKISTEAVCQVIGIDFKNSTLAFHGTTADVKIVDKSKCGRLCSYMIPQCEPQIGGYFVQYANPNDTTRVDDWMAEAALVCDGKLYGVVELFEIACDASLAGLAPKPEAVLHMHLSTAKLLEGPPTKRPRKTDTAADRISTSAAAWLALIATLVFPPRINMQ